MKTFITLTIFSFATLTLSADFLGQLKESASEQSNQAETNALSAATGALGDGTQSQIAQAAATQSLLASAVDHSKKLGSLLSTNPEMKDLLTNSMTSLAQKQDFIALQDINKLTSAKLSPEQSTLAKSLRSDIEVLALKRNLPESGPITAASQSIQSGNYTAAIPQLQQSLQSGQLTDPQKQLVQSIIGSHNAVEATSGAASAIEQTAK